MFIVKHTRRDEYGKVVDSRWNMRAYKRKRSAVKVADSVKGGYVCRMGSNSPIYVGSWPL